MSAFGEEEEWGEEGLLAGQPPEEMAAEDLLPWQAGHVLRLKRSQMEEEGKCKHCFLFQSYCICQPIADMFAAVRAEQCFRSQIHLFMHFKEWGRSSNTGKLMQLGLADNCRTTCFGVPGEEEELAATLLAHPSIILYPSPSAEPISSRRDWYAGHNGNVHIVVIDSTWPQSHAMDRRLPQSIPRVRIDEMVEGPSLFLNRKQSKTKTKVSTLEATVMALRSLDTEPKVLDLLEQSLRYGVDAVLRQCGKKTVYGNQIVPADISAGNYTKASVSKPDLCTHCGKARAQGVNFRNVGVRKRRNEHGEEISYRVWKCTGCDEFFHVSSQVTHREEEEGGVQSPSS